MSVWRTRYGDFATLGRFGPTLLRHLAFSQHHDPNWFAGGGYAWDVVRNRMRMSDNV